MQRPITNRHASRLRLSAFLLATVAMLPCAAFSQPFRIGFETPPQPELGPPQVDVVAGPVAARLEQARALARDNNWTEAIAAYRDVATENADRLIALDDHRYVTLRTYCQLQIAQLPAEGLAEYRRSADPLAERWYREAMTARNEQLLRRIVAELFCSSWGDDALLALGEMALERADYSAARRHWEQSSPLLRDPTGVPLWIALRDIDVNAHWPEIEKRWNDRTEPPHWLAFPDTSLDLADIRARLILTSIRAGDLDRAAVELDFFRHAHAAAIGRLAGQEGPYVPALERLLSTAREWSAQPAVTDWTTFAGSPSRCSNAPALGDIAGPVWPKPVTFPPIKKSQRVTMAQGFDLGASFGGGLEKDDDPEQITRESQRPLRVFPIVVGSTVLFNDGMQIRAVDLATGTPINDKNGILYTEPLDKAIHGLRNTPTGELFFTAAHGVPRSTLTAVGPRVYGRVGRFATTRFEPRLASIDDKIVGIDLSRDGLLAFQAKPENAYLSFDGAPVGDGRRLWVAMRQSDVSPRAIVACYDATAGTIIWKTPIGAAETPAAGHGDEITHNLLTFVDDRVYFNTNLGLVAALDANTGKICWLHRYDRTSGDAAQGLDAPPWFDRDPSPCMYVNGMVIVAPADTPAVFALDSQTGRRMWTNAEMPDAQHLLGVVKNSLILSGNRLYSLDLRSGASRYAWPESEHAGIRGIGRGLIAGDEIFWPTRDAIYVMNAVTGARTRPPISLRGISDFGANLAAGNGHLIIAAHDTLTALGPKPTTTNRTSQPGPPNPAKATPRN